MGAISRIMAGWSAPSVSDDGHWTTVPSLAAYASSSGVVVSEELALRNPVVNDCVNILMDAVGQTPTIVYDRTGAKGEERERSVSRLAYRLREQPNDDQTAIEFKREMQQSAAFYRFAFAEIEWRGAEPVNVTPRHPMRIRTAQTAVGKRYEYLEDDHTTWRPIPPANMLRIPGRPVLRYAGETLGQAIALERYSSRLFGRGLKPSLLLSTDPSSIWTKPAKDKLKDEIQSEHGGPDRAGGVMILPEGLKPHQLAMTNEQAQYDLIRQALIGDITRFWRIPPYMVGLLMSGTVSYASVDTQGVDFVVYCLMPWLIGWEQAMQRDLLVDKRGQFVEFLTAQLLRGTTKERYDVYAIAIERGIMSVNEVRRLENLNPRAGGDTFLVPMNKAPAGPQQLDAGSPAHRLLETLITDAAGNVLRRETSALARVSEKAGPDAHAWESGVRDFYDGHAGYVAEKLKVPMTVAVAWAAQQQYRVLSEGPGVAATWNGTESARLAQLALHEGTREVATV